MAPHHDTELTEIGRNLLNRKLRRLIRNFKNNPENPQTLRVFHRLGGDIESDLQTLRPSTLLCYACKHNAVNSVTFLVCNAAADVEQCDSTGAFPLQIAVKNGHDECTRILLRSGANPNRPTASHETLLSLAMSHSKYESVRLLIEAGASVNVTGISLLLAVMLMHHNIQVAEWLIRAGTLPLPLDWMHSCVILSDPYYSLEFVSLLASAGFELYCPGWISRTLEQENPTDRQRCLCDWLVDSRRNPAPLRQLCRVAVRVHLATATNVTGSGRATSFRQQISLLPLPSLLQRYVALEAN